MNSRGRRRASGGCGLPVREGALAGWSVPERIQAGAQSLWVGESAARFFIWDAKRAIDYLVSRRAKAGGIDGRGPRTVFSGEINGMAGKSHGGKRPGSFGHPAPRLPGGRPPRTFRGELAYRLAGRPDWVESAGHACSRHSARGGPARGPVLLMLCQSAPARAV